jgi:hypothetical protein
MGLSGSLEDLALPQVLQLLSSNRLTGKLTLTRPDGRGVIVLRDGKIIFTTTDAARETIGSLLLLKGKVSPPVLAKALRIQRTSTRERRLGSVLMEMGAVDAETLRRVVAEQFSSVLAELIGWQSGHVRFQHLDVEERGEVAIDAGDFLWEDGLATDSLLFRILSQGVEDGDADDEALASDLDALLAPIPEGTVAPRTSLKQIMANLRSPTFTAEAALDILQLAGTLFARGALFLNSGHLISGIGQFGFDLLPGVLDVRAVRVLAGDDPTLEQVLETRETYRGVLPRCFRTLWGDADLGEVAILPMSVADRVELLLYGDNGPGGPPLPPLEPLEILLFEAGVSIEKAALEGRLRELEARKGALGGRDAD